MSTETAADTISSIVNEYEKLRPRQVTIHEWRVLSWRNGGLTVHKVDLHDVECTCGDQTWNKQDPAVCDHIAVALDEAEKTMGTEESLLYFSHDVLQDIDRAVSRLEQKATSVESAAHAAEQQASAPAQDDSEPETPVDDRPDPVEAVTGYLRDQGVPVDKLKVWKHDDLGSIQIDTDGYLEDDEFEALQNATSVDWINYDRDEGVNFVKPDNFAEVGA